MATFTFIRNSLKLLAVSSLFASSAFAALAPTDIVDLKVLVLSADGSEPSYAAWTAALDREGVPYDTIIANTADPIVPATLASAANHAKYQAVILATGSLYQCGANGCASALDPTEWAALNAFETRFGVRRVTAYAYPTPDYGLNWPFSSGDVSGSTANLTTAGKTAFPYLAGPVPMDSGAWGYYAEPLPPVVAAPGVPASSFTTLVAGPVGPGGAASSLVGVYARPDGFEEMVVTVATNQYQLHSLLMGHGLVAWATKGVRLGYARNYFTMHVDDVFLPDDRWDINAKVTHEDDGATLPTIRMVAADIDRALAWQKTNGIQLDFVFNGGGSDEVVDNNSTTVQVGKKTKIVKGRDPLLDRVLLNKADFHWINHTYTHMQLDLATLDDIVNQVGDNFAWAKSKGIPVEKKVLVTGEHSGLANPNMPAALAQLGINWIASDNSKQPNPYAIGPATTIPRYPANIYYNVGTFQEQLDEYNWIYYYNCTNTATTTCFSQPADWATYVNNEATIMLRHLLLNDVRPHYIHQSNLAEDGTGYAVMDAVLARYKSYVTTPLVQPLFAEAGEIMEDQNAWKTERAAVTAYYKNGNIVVSSSITTEFPLTGYNGGTLYGTEKSAWINLAAGQTKSFKAVNTL